MKFTQIINSLCLLQMLSSQEVIGYLPWLHNTYNIYKVVLTNSLWFTSVCHFSNTFQLPFNCQESVNESEYKWRCSTGLSTLRRVSGRVAAQEFRMGDCSSSLQFSTQVESMAKFVISYLH